ncbi:MAG: DHA2 family efflux MFS transporter permease subunit [Bifidobacteriaceae bacterium]|jgi:EmrB/QacA subfamily drug resistance transporter|nr:DHA2 family efflux MFS transporter permease subunit [Bifidobacteriaceae bacterium]MCI1978897.1 DHA2 family efflux MFS transporter permease subunit [Bifidobacteriaceae bacterium]
MTAPTRGKLAAVRAHARANTATHTNTSASAHATRMKSPNNQGSSPQKIPAKVFCAVIAAGLLSLSGVVVETAMNITFPTLMREFSISTDTVQWMTTIYLLIVSIIVPLSASFKARFPTKKLFITANLLFIAGLIIDLTAPVFPMLLLGRAVQGLGTGIALPLMFNIILEQVPPAKIGMMMGFGTLITAVAPAIGPTFGGVVVSTMSWRYIFAFLLPVLVISLVMGIISIEQKSKLRKVPFDFLSIALIAVTFCGIVLGFSSMASNTFFSLRVGGAMLIGCIALVAFAMRQMRLKSPILDLRLFGNLNFSGYVIAFFLFQLSALGLSFVLPNYIQLVDGSSALQAGLLLLPGAAIGALLAPLSGRLLDALGPKPPLLSGPLIAIIALALFTLLNGHLGNAGICIIYVIYMLGTGITMGNTMTTGLSQLSGEQKSDGNAIFTTIQQFAAAVGTSVAATLVAVGQNATTDQAQGTSDGSHLAFVALLIALIIQYAATAKVTAFPFRTRSGSKER